MWRLFCPLAGFALIGDWAILSTGLEDGPCAGTFARPLAAHAADGISRSPDEGGERMSRRSFISLSAVVYGLVLFAGPGSMEAATYRWTDEQGNVHFTNDLATVPAPLLDQVEDVPLPEPAADPPDRAPDPVTAGPPSGETRDTEYEDPALIEYEDCVADLQKVREDVEQSLARDRELLDPLNRGIHLSATAHKRQDLQRTRAEVNARIEENQNRLETEIPRMEWECGRKKPYIP